MDSFRGDPENEAKPPCPGGFCINMKIHELFEGFLKDCEADGLHPYTRHHHEKICHKVIAPALEGIEIESLLPVHANRIIEFASRFSKSLPERAILTFRNWYVMLRTVDILLVSLLKKLKFRNTNDSTIRAPGRNRKYPRYARKF